MSEVEETLKRINSHKGVQGIVIINADGVPIRSTLEQTMSTNYAAHIMQLSQKARSAVRTLDPQNDLTFLRIRSKKHEILVAPEKVCAVHARPLSGPARRRPPPMAPSPACCRRADSPAPYRLQDFTLVVVQNPNAEQ